LWTTAYGAVCLTAGEVYRLDPGRGCIAFQKALTCRNASWWASEVMRQPPLAGPPDRRLRNCHGTRCLSIIMPR
jgi:hypothetical protein